MMRLFVFLYAIVLLLSMSSLTMAQKAKVGRSVASTLLAGVLVYRTPTVRNSYLYH